MGSRDRDCERGASCAVAVARRMFPWPAMAVLLGGLLASTTVHAGAWMQEPGSYYAKGWLRLVRGSRGVLANGNQVELRSPYTDAGLNFYAEEGLSERFTLVYFGTLAAWAAVGDESAIVLGPLSVGGRFGLLQDAGFELALQGHYGFAPPIGDDFLFTDETPKRDGYYYRPIESTHRFELELQAGKSVSWGWVELMVGVRANTEGRLGSVGYGLAKVGYTGWQGWVLDVHVTTHQPFDEVSESNISGAGQTRYVGLGVAGTYWLAERWGLVAGIEGAPMMRSNARTPVWLMGVEHKG